MTNNELLDEMRRIRKMYVLKGVMRYQSVRNHDVHSESVAEHLFGMQIISTYFLPLEDPSHTLDWAKISELILFHEIGEIETGDILFHKKNADHVEEERRAAKRVAAQLPESLRTLALERFTEFDTCVTPEAVFADAIDKIEPIFELLDDKAYGWLKKHNITREIGTNGKLLATEKFPHMRRFLDAWIEHMVSKEVFATLE
ncbi:MAG: HD domain-containing protein [Patescibacteria group bacterium]